MTKYVINGGKTLNGEVTISGAKNAAVAIVPAALLADGPVRLENVPKIDLPQLPLVLSAAQWLEEQALADGCFGLALGLPLHLGLPPFVTGSKTAVKVLTEDMKELTGGQVIINGDAKESADILEQIILEKRQGLHI